MKQLLAKFALAGLLVVNAAAATSYTYESSAELISTGDFDGDGRQDVLIVDRATGVFRVGYQTSANVYTWADPRASGIESASGLAVGKLFSNAHDGAAVSSAVADRVNLLDFPTATGQPQLVNSFPPGAQPNKVIAINIPGSGDDPTIDDLVAASDGNDPPNPGRLALLRNAVGSTTLIVNGFYPITEDANRVILKQGVADFAGVLVRSGADDEFRVLAPGSGAYNQKAARAGVAAGSRFVYGFFNGTAYSHILFYKPGQSNFVASLVSEPVPGTYSLGALVSFDLGAKISQIISISRTTTDRLLVIFADGLGAVYDFNGTAAPTIAQTLSADSGEAITGAAPTPSGDFLLLSGAGSKSTGVRRYSVNGAGYTAGPKTSLPAVTPLSGQANVFIFQTEPFVSGQPNLLRSINAGDWTSDLLISAGNYSANVWDFLGGSLGLRNPVNRNFGPTPPGGLFGLANQYLPSISIFSRAPGIGDEIVDVRISPDPGEYKTAVKVTLSTPTVGTFILYRTNPSDAWSNYSGPITLYRTTTLEYYGAAAVPTKRSRIHVANFVFPTDPAVQDSNHDGIPDYVEVAKGLDPTGGKDQDGDGFTDLNELIAGTDPLDDTSVPTDQQRLEEKAAFDLALGLQPLDGTTVSPSTSLPGANVRTYDLTGSILRAGTTATLSLLGVADPAAWETNIVLDTDPPLISAATDTHFDITTAGSDKSLGRELLGIIAVPRPQLPQIPYMLGNDTLDTEASNWVASAKATYTSIPRELVKANLDINDTLTALLFERKVSQILLNRGNAAGSNMTLFAFRPTDVGRTNPSAKLLQSLQTRLDDTHPGFKLATVFSELEGMVASDLTPLKDLTKEIYRISSASNNAAPATYPSPVDTLRAFLETGALQSNYALVASGIDLTAAMAAFNTAMSNVTGRPTITLDLAVRPDTFGGTCTMLDTTSVPAAQKTLIHPGGEQYRLLETFNLLPGTIIHVFGYTDVVNPGCSGDAIEVISLALDSVPEASPIDTDGDLLIDALEFLLFGSLSNNGMGDADGDGYSNLQEFFDGSDPLDGGSHGPVVFNLSPPAVALEKLANGDIHLSFNWPAQYTDRVKFTIKSTPELGTPFVMEALPAVQNPAGHFEATLPAPSEDHKYYIVSMALM